MDVSTGTVLTRLWEFGDGQYSTEQNPVHAYGIPGTYTVRLRVSNDVMSDTVKSS